MTVSGAGRAYDTYSTVLVCVFVGFGRLFMEWALGGTYLLFPPSDLALAFAYYWLEAFLLAGVLALVLGAPWRSGMPMALAATAFDLAAPLVDRLIAAGPFQYGYAWNFPRDFPWALYAPKAGFTAGEAAAWWLAVLFLAGYTLRKKRSPPRALLAAALAYAAAAVLLGVVPTLSALVRSALAWPPEHQRTVLVLLYLLAAVAVYGALSPAVVRGLARRVRHALPFTAFCLAGSAFAGGVFDSTLVYAGLLLLTFIAALAQNDFHDAAEDAVQGREPYLDGEDMRFLTVCAVLAIGVLAGAGTLAAVPLLVVLVLSVLYSFPFYRGKRYFPSNLKMEGMWGLSSFTLGLVAAIEHRAYGAPRWWLSSLPEPSDPGLLRAFDGVTLAAMVLALGGYSLVAVLKDYKDWEADRDAGIQTIYTLASRRGYALERVHTAALAASAAALFAAPILLALAGRVAWAPAAAGPVAAAGLWVLMAGRPSPRAFAHTLYLLTAYFLFLAAALSA